MRGLMRLFGAIVLGCLAILFVSTTITVLKQNWFGKSGGRNHVAVIDLSGTITSASSFVKDLKELTEKNSVKAIVVRINSPGGVVGPSQEMYEALKKADEKIPVIAAIGTLGASGGYYAALGARKIYANPGSLTASIGVIMELINTEKLYQWARLEAYTLKAGKLKDVGSPLRRMTPEEREFLETMLKDIHAQFRGAVKERRKLTDAELEASTDGRVMTGSQAKAAKLVDTLGGVEDALKEAKKLASLPDDAPVEYPRKNKGMLKELLLGDDDGNSEESLYKGIVKLLHPPTSGFRLMMIAPISMR
jgi:protease IV